MEEKTLNLGDEIMELRMAQEKDYEQLAEMKFLSVL